MSAIERIWVNPAVRGMRPVVRGTRVRVADVLAMLADGASEADILADFPHLTSEDVRACLAWAPRAADHPIVLAAE